MPKAVPFAPSPPGEGAQASSAGDECARRASRPRAREKSLHIGVNSVISLFGACTDMVLLH